MDIGIVGLGRMGGNMARRFASRGGGGDAGKLRAMMRKSFGGRAPVAGTGR